jgi:hypothetical protein
MNRKKYSILCALIYSLSTDAVNVIVHNTIPFNIKMTWEFVGDYFRRDVPAATPEKVGSKGVDDWRLHKGFSKVRIIGAKVGQVWGNNPETGDELEFTPAMIDKNGEVWGIKPDLYNAPAGQAVYHNFRLTIIPKKNPQDNNNWWPSFDIARMDADVFAPLIKAFAPLKDFFDDVGKYTTMAFKVMDALAQKRPLTGFQLKDKPEYVGKSRQPSPPTIAQEREELVAARDKLPREEIEKRMLYDQELAILDAIKKYSPIVYLEGTERATPIAPEEFFAGETTMIREKDNSRGNPVVIARGKVTFRAIADLVKKNPKKEYMIWHGQEKEPLRYDKRIFYGSNPQYYPNGIPMQVVTFYGHDNDRRLIESSIRALIAATEAAQSANAAKQQNPSSKDLTQKVTKAEELWSTTLAKALKDIAGRDPAWEQALRDSVGTSSLDTSLGHLRNLMKRAQEGSNAARKDYFYIQWLFLYGYNQPYTITIPLGTVFKGDYINLQNAHESDLEHMTMKVNATTGKLEGIEYGAHGGEQGMWLYPPGTTDNPFKEFTVQDGHPVVFVAHGGHGNYPREGAYTRIYGLANDVTQRSKLMWPLSEKNIYRTVPRTSVGFNPLLHKDNPDYSGYLDFRGVLGPRGVSSPINQPWFGSSEGIHMGVEGARDPVDVHMNHFCPGYPADSGCVRSKNKQSPPPGKKRNDLVKFLQDIKVL